MAGVRETLGKLGIPASSIQIEAGKKEFTVSYDASKVKPEAMLEALKAHGEPAKIKS